MFYLIAPSPSAFCFRSGCNLSWFSSRQLLSGFPVLGLPRTALLSLGRESLRFSFSEFSLCGFLPLLEFSGLHCCLFVKVRLQAFLLLACLCCQLSDNYNRISQPFRFVNRFLDFLSIFQFYLSSASRFLHWRWIFIISLSIFICQCIFAIFRTKYPCLPKSENRGIFLEADLQFCTQLGAQNLQPAGQLIISIKPCENRVLRSTLHNKFSDHSQIHHHNKCVNCPKN